MLGGREVDGPFAGRNIHPSVHDCESNSTVKMLGGREAGTRLRIGTFSTLQCSQLVFDKEIEMLSERLFLMIHEEFLFVEFMRQLVGDGKAALKRGGHQASLLHNLLHSFEDEAVLLVHMNGDVQGDFRDAGAFFVIQAGFQSRFPDNFVVFCATGFQGFGQGAAETV